MATKKKAASSTASAGSSRKSTAKKASAKKATTKKATTKKPAAKGGRSTGKAVGRTAGSRSVGAASDLYPDMVVVEREIGGRKLSIETGRMMKLSDGAVVARYGDTVVLAAVNSNKAPEGFDFFPLTVDYREKTSAAGIIPGGFFKREGRPTTKEILACRIIDRSIRPMFPDGFKRDVQVLSQVISSDRENDGDVLAAVASFAALALSSLPHGRTLGMVRIGMVDDELVVNPTWSQLQGGDNKLNLTVAGHEDAIAMVEAGAQEVKEDTILEALELAHDVIRDIVEMVEELVSKAGKPKMDFEPPVVDSKVQKAIEKQFGKALRAAPVTKGPKQVRQAAIKAARDEAKAAFPAPDGLSESERKAYDKMVGDIIGGIVKQAERDSILEKSTRADGREPDTIRPITIEVGVLPRTHGSTLFTRGETQALGVVTLGGTDDQQIIDGLMPEPRKRFLLHYAFPPFSVGETKRMLAPGRREIGHGALAERGLEPVLPEHEEFPYTIRITSEVLESNGSSSMATACAGTLAMMDAGVPIKQPVAGIAMGLVMEGKKYAILSDILGSEDACGDMDFKVVGTGRGITALQMDIKCEGLTREILSEALEQARKGRVHILREMLKVLDTPREKLSDNAPRLVSVQVPPDKIGTIIGPGGKNIRMLQEQYECKISIEDSGLCTITGVIGEKVDACVEYVSQMTAEVELGSVYEGTVSAIKEFGAFVEILPGQEGLVHVSELSNEFIRAVTDVVRIGDKVKVKVIAIDDFGKVKLSRKALLEGGDEGAAGDGDGGDDRGRPRRDRGDRDRGDRGDRGDRERGDRERGERRERGDRDRDQDRGERRPRRDRGDREERFDDERDERPRRGRGDREERRPRRDRDERYDGESRPPRRPRSESGDGDDREERDARGDREDRPRRQRERGDREERGDRDREERRPRRSREDRDDDDRGDREDRPRRRRERGGREERPDRDVDREERHRRSSRRPEPSEDDGDERSRRGPRRPERDDDDRPRRGSARPERSDEDGDERPLRRGRSRGRPADEDVDAEERPAGRRSGGGAGGGGRGRSRDRAMPIEDFDDRDDAPRPFAGGGDEVGELESLDSLLADEGEGGRPPRRRSRRSRR